MAILLSISNRLKVLRLALACLCDPVVPFPPQLLVAFLQRRRPMPLAQDLRLARKDRLVVLLLLVPGGLVALVVMVLLLGRSLWALLKLLLPIKTQDMAMVKMEGTALVVMVLLVGSNLLPLAMVFLLLQLVKMQGMPMVKTQDMMPMILVCSHLGMDLVELLPARLVYLMLVPRLPMIFLLEALLIALPARGLVNNVLVQALLILLLMFLQRLQLLILAFLCLQDRLLVRRHIVGPRTNLSLSGGIVIMGMHQILHSLSALPLQACHARGLAILLRGT